MAAAVALPPLPRVPVARPPVALRRLGELVLETVTDPKPFDPYRLDARDPDFVRALLPLFEQIATRYLRAEIDGLEHLEPGPVLYVANHNGGILGPDLFCTLSALWRQLGPDAPLHPMAHDLAMQRVTPLGRVLARLGALRAHPSNALRALRAGRAVLAYPGGEREAYRPFHERNRIAFGDHAGFLRVAHEARAPIVPIVAHGAHRSAIFLHQGRWLAERSGLRRWARIERFPIALGLPWGLGLGPWVPYFPLPFPVRLRVLPPRRVGADLEAARASIVRDMQAALDELAAR
jgi:1-acyl-sn-glycerol-3-phosphate acyltransferase